MNGVVVVVAMTVVLPIVVVAERTRRGAGRRVAVGAVRALGRACGIRFEAIGRELLPTERLAVLVPNHASPVDIPALLATVPDVRFVAAAELFRIPLLGAAIRALGSIPVDRSRPRAGGGRLALGDGDDRPIVVFAEGGIPEPGQTPRFQTGAFVLAIDAGAPVVPVTIRGAASVLPRGAKVWARPGVVTVELHPPIATGDLTLRDRKALRDRTEAIVRAPAPPPR